MADSVLYGKIVIDAIHFQNCEPIRDVLGGGLPQAAAGARIWTPSVALLCRSGTDMPARARESLLNLDIDLAGWVQYEDIPTLHCVMRYDEDGYLIKEVDFFHRQDNFLHDLNRLVAREIQLPESCRAPGVIHMLTEFAEEPMVAAAQSLQKQGARWTLEPLMDFHDWSNRDAMLALFPHVDVLTPDWPTASGIAGSEDPRTVLQHWSRFGPELVVVRDGERGSYVWDSHSDRMWHVPIVPVQVVDPTGCGNAYGGGLSVGWDLHRDGKLAACCGTVSASFLAEVVGVPEHPGELQGQAFQRLEQLLERVEAL